MSASEPQLPKPPWWRRKWVTVGEVIAVIGLAVGVLGYLDTQRQHRQEAAERAATARQAVKREALLLTATAAEDGARLTLAPLRAGQAIQTQRYLFPRAVLDHPMEVTAAQPQIDRAWIEGGLKSTLAAADAPREGEGQLPVGVTTTYLEDGETRTDTAVYRVGYRIAPGGLFGGRRVRLQGLALVEHGAAGDLGVRVERAWGGGARLR